MSPVLTLRTPQEQAARWRQGRTAADAELKALALENSKAKFLASCIRKFQPQETNLVTEKLPGYSWHQWGEACNCVWVDPSGRVNWNTHQLGNNGYHVIAEEAAKLGLFTGGAAGGKTPFHLNWGHIQLRDYDVLTLGVEAIEAEMKKRFCR